MQPGMRSVLNVNLNTLFSSIQLSYPTLENGSIMSDDWKWVLRSASATRPVMRLIEPYRFRVRRARAQKTRVAMFSDTHGILKVSAGDGAAGRCVRQRSRSGHGVRPGDFRIRSQQSPGQPATSDTARRRGAPAAAFRTSYSREIAGGSPEVSLTMRQLYLCRRASARPSPARIPPCPRCAPCRPLSTTIRRSATTSRCNTASPWIASRSWST